MLSCSQYLHCCYFIHKEAINCKLFLIHCHNDENVFFRLFSVFFVVISLEHSEMDFCVYFKAVLLELFSSHLLLKPLLLATKFLFYCYHLFRIPVLLLPLLLSLLPPI